MSGGTSAAIVGGTILSGVIGGVAQSNAAGKAAKAQEAASENAIAAQQGMFNIANQNLQPFIQTGSSAANKVSQLEGLNGGSPSSIQATLESLPGYQFANTQGLKSVQNNATQRGLGLSGAALKGAANFSTGLANQQYNNLLTGVQNTENTGEQAAGSLGNIAMGTGQGIAQSNTNYGQAAAGAALATGSAIANAASSIPNGLITGQLLQNQANQGNSLTSQYGNINANGQISNDFENAQNASANTTFGQ